FEFPLELPSLPGTNLLGGRLCWLYGRKAVLTFYQTSAGRFWLFVLDQQGFAVAPKRRSECTAAGGYEVCLVSRVPEVLAMVADKRQTDLVMPELKRLTKP